MTQEGILRVMLMFIRFLCRYCTPQTNAEMIPNAIVDGAMRLCKLSFASPKRKRHCVSPDHSGRNVAHPVCTGKQSPKKGAHRSKQGDCFVMSTFRAMTICFVFIVPQKNVTARYEAVSET